MRVSCVPSPHTAVPRRRAATETVGQSPRARAAASNCVRRECVSSARDDWSIFLQISPRAGWQRTPCCTGVALVLCYEGGCRYCLGVVEKWANEMPLRDADCGHGLLQVARLSPIVLSDRLSGAYMCLLLFDISFQLVELVKSCCLRALNKHPHPKVAEYIDTPRAGPNVMHDLFCWSCITAGLY